MRNLLTATLLLVNLLPGLVAAEMSVSSTVTIRPGNVDEATDKLLKKAATLNGYFIRRSNSALSLRIPGAGADALLKFVEDNWIVYAQEYNTRDTTMELATAHSRLKAKEDLLSEYTKVLDSAADNKIVKVSAATATLVGEIERLKGRINFLQNQNRYASITIRFRSRHSKVESEQLTSSFDWINQTGLKQLLVDF